MNDEELRRRVIAALKPLLEMLLELEREKADAGAESISEVPAQTDR